MKNSHGIKCKNCGAELNIDVSKDIVECEFCNTEYLLSDIAGNSIKRKIQTNQAKSALKKFLSVMFCMFMLTLSLCYLLSIEELYYQDAYISITTAIIGAAASVTAFVMKLVKKIKSRLRYIIPTVLSVVMLLATGLTTDIPAAHDIVWEEIILAEHLPEPPTSKGNVLSNNLDRMYIDLYNVSEKQLTDYIKTCQNAGFNIDAKKDYGYRAYNSEGYLLELNYYSDVMRISFDTPLEAHMIEIPQNPISADLPVPKSNMGVIDSETSRHFSCRICNTPPEDFSKYVQECIDNGFNVDYSRSDDSFYASHADGRRISVLYEGFNIMNISIY